MRRFKFPLQTLLRIRRLREREAKRKVAAQRAEIARLDHLNETTWAEISTQHAALLQTQRRATIQPADLARARTWIAHLRATIAQRTLLRAEMTARLEELQSEFTAARQQARIIQRLRERRWDEYRRQRDHKDQAASDELAQQMQSSAAADANALWPAGKNADARDLTAACGGQ